MAGRTTWQPLEQVEMKGLSSNNGLRYYYELSQCTNLSEFVALADKRFTIRGYWEGSEKRLKKELIKFFKSAQRKSSLIHNNRKKSTVDSDTGRIEVESAISDLQPTIKKTETPVLNVAEEAEPLTFEQRQEIVAELIEDEQRQEIVAELMKGSAHSDTFDELDINDITRDDGLCNCYNSKKPQSLSDFLAMGEKRLDIPDHDDESEKKLHEELTKFFESQASIDVYQNSTAQIEEDPTTVYGQNLEDVPAPTRSTKEQQNASPTAPTEKLSEASEDPPEISALPPTEIEDFVEDLLAGNIKWEPFKKKEMRNLTSNIVLRNIYKKSACANLSDFLAHSPKRRQWSQYWKKDQQLLKKELIRHFQLVSQTREVIENSPPERQTEKQATTKIESNSSHTSAESVKEVTEKLLSGDAGVEAFDHLCIGDISSNVRLENVYESSGVTNLSEFFAIGAKRMKIKNYGKLSERRLNEAVQRFLTNHSHEISSEYVRGVEGNESEAIDYDNILSSETPEKLISASTWKSWKLKLTDLRVMNEHVFYICQEIGENWPVKNGWQNKTIGDFCSSSLKELLSAKNFGKMKLRALIKAAAYLLTDRRKTILDQSPKERLHWLKNTIQLDKREQEIYVRRSKGETLDEIGRSLDVTRERIRQIQKGILFKYRSPLGLQICSDFLDQKQQSIWHSVAKGKLHLPKSTVLDINGLELTDMECFALFVYTGDKVKGERFSAIVAEFFNRRFQQTANHWIDLPYDAFDISAAISLAQSAINRTSTPIAFKELANRLPHIDQGLLRIAIQLSESINSFYGYLVRGRLTPRKRRAIGAHVTLNELEKNDIIVSTNTLLRAYSHAFGSDNCNERDIEVVMADHNHLFFKIGQEGWISTGTPGMTESKLLIANAELEEDEPETELNEASLKTQQIAEALTKTGIAHVTAIQKQLNYDGVHVPMTSIQPMLHSSELFVRFAPGFYGLKAHIQDQDAIKQARTTIIDSPINPRIPILQLRSYVFSRYAGEPKDVHILWGNEMEKLWAENLFEQEDDDLAKSFWFLLSPNDISKDPEIIERYKKRRANCQYKLNSNMPNINAAKRVDFDDILSSLVYLKKAGQISCARSNMLMGRRVDGLHSVSLLATLVLLDTVQPEDDWRKAHYLKGSIDELIQDLKDAYSRNPDINWETGLSKLLLPTIDSNMNLELYGWIKKINVDQLRDHFHPLEAVKPKQTVDLSVSTTRSPNGGIQI